MEVLFGGGKSFGFVPHEHPKTQMLVRRRRQESKTRKVLTRAVAQVGASLSIEDVTVHTSKISSTHIQPSSLLYSAVVSAAAAAWARCRCCRERVPMQGEKTR